MGNQTKGQPKKDKKKEQNPDDMDRENNELTPDCQPESLLNDPCLRTLLPPKISQFSKMLNSSVHQCTKPLISMSIVMPKTKWGVSISAGVTVTVSPTGMSW